MVAENLLKSIDQFEDFQKALEVVSIVLSEDFIAQLIDWDHLNQIALHYLQKQPFFSYIQELETLDSWKQVVNLYENYNGTDKLKELA